MIIVGSALFAAASTFNDNINILIGKSLYVGSTNYIRIHQSRGGSFIDFTDGLNIRNAGSTTVLALNSSNNQGTFNYNLNTTGITNGTNAIINNGILTQNLTANINSDLNVSGTPTFYCNGSFPTASTGGSRGLGVHWNVMSGGGYGETSYLNYTQGGGGGHTWYYANAATPPTILINLNSAKILSLINNVSCVSLSSSGAISCASLSSTGAISCASLAATCNISCSSLIMSEILTITDTTQTSSESSGCLVLSDGIGIKKSLNCLVMQIL